jgi:hypothetical protein
MKQSRFTEERIIAVLREQEAGSKTGEVCRKDGIVGRALDAVISRRGPPAIVSDTGPSSQAWPSLSPEIML